MSRGPAPKEIGEMSGSKNLFFSMATKPGYKYTTVFVTVARKILDLILVKKLYFSSKPIEIEVGLKVKVSPVKSCLTKEEVLISDSQPLSHHCLKVLPWSCGRMPWLYGHEMLLPAHQSVTYLSTHMFLNC